MIQLHRSVPQCRRRNVLDMEPVGFAAFVSAASLATLLAIVIAGAMVDHFVTQDAQPSRLQPALDQIQRFGERKCWSGEVVR